MSLFLWGCGVLVDEKQHDTFEVQLALGQSKYDSGAYSAALPHAERAAEINPHSENAAILLGYVYLALAGVAPYELASEMILKEEVKPSESGNKLWISKITLIQGNAEGGNSGNMQLAEDPDKKSGGTNEVLGDLSSIIGLTEAEFSKLGVLNLDDSELPVIEPICADEARQLIPKLALVNKAIATICPFVDIGVRIPDEDARHSCRQKPGLRAKTGKSHFLWAFTHLTEALAFHSVLTYSTTDQDKTNLELRSEKVKNQEVQDPSNLGDFLEEVASLDKLVGKIMPTDPVCSQIYPQTQMSALVTDMVAVNTAFKAMPGIPEKITKAITASMTKIEEIRSKSSDGDDRSKQQSSAFKGDFTQKMGESLGIKIDELANSGEEIDPEELLQICASYDSITGGQASQEDKPAACGNLD